MLYVAEIFRSLQGESTFAGLACVFVRLAGCNLKCTWCDTAYARAGGEQMTVDEIVARVGGLGSGIVEVTGGEPLVQEDTPKLLHALGTGGRTVLLETNGSILIPPERAWVTILDLKCPSSGEAGRMCLANAARLAPADNVKFVVADRRDFQWAVETARRLDLFNRELDVLISPVAGQCNPAELADWVLTCGLGFRLQLQLHKILWPETERGV